MNNFPTSEDMRVSLHLADLATKGALVLIVAFILTLLLRKSSGAQRHFTWLCAIAGLLAVSAGSLLLRPRPVTVAQSNPVMRSTLGHALIRPAEQLYATSSTPIFVSVQPSKPASDPAPEQASTPLSTLRVSPPFAIGVVWAIGSILALLAMLAGLGKAAWIMRRAQPLADGAVLDLLDDLRQRLSIRRHVRIRLLSPGSVPAMLGFLRPTILLPADVQGWDEGKLRLVLLHELGHVQRLDWLSFTAARLIVALHWFNPFAWLALAQLRKEGERACDDLVLSFGVAGTEYATCLLDIARHITQPASIVPATLGMARKPQIEERLRAIIDGTKNRRSLARWASLSLATLAVAAGTAFAVLRPALAPSAAGEPESDVIVANGDTAILPNGVKIELQGFIGMAEASTADSWDINKKPVIKNGWRETVSDQPLPGMRFRITTPMAYDCSSTGIAFNLAPARGEKQIRDLRVSAGKLLPRTPLTAPSTLFLPRGTKSFDYRLELATGKWNTVAVIPNTLKASAIREPTPNLSQTPLYGEWRNIPIFWDLSDTPSIGYDGSHSSQKLNMLPRGQRLGDTARRLTAYDAKGYMVPLGMSTWGMDGTEQGRFDEALLRRIKEFRLETRPYQWVEFRHVAAQPVAKALQGAATQTATRDIPGFTRKLGAATLRVNSVTGFTTVGGRSGRASWTPDGRNLRWAVGFDEPVQRVGRAADWKAGSPTMVSLSIKSPKDTSMTLELTNTQAKSGSKIAGWFCVNHVSGDAVVGGTFKPGAESCDLKLGIAEGAWQTVDTQAIDIPRRSKAGDSSKRSSLEDDMHIYLSGEPRIAYRGADGTMIRRDFKGALSSLHGNAARIVAITKDGRTVELQSGDTNSAIKSIKGSSGAGARLLSSSPKIHLWDVKAIQIQVRPFQWTNFGGIALRPRL